MTTPKFSILIPTRDRYETFIHSMATVLAQPGSDFELVVADNASRPNIREAVERVTAIPVTYTRSDDVIPMTENWLRGLSQCRGEYITVLGDDDGLMPSALPWARKVLSNHRPNVLSWNLHYYWWPDAIHKARANQIKIIHPGNAPLSSIASKEILKAYFSGSVGLDRLPMIYNSFVQRSMLLRAQETWGSMIPLPHCPDVYTGLFNLCLTDQILFSPRPLAMRGVSGKSFGSSGLHPKAGKAVLEKGLRDEGLALTPASGSRIPLHPDLLTPNGIGCENFHLHMANIKLCFRDVALPGHKGLTINISQVINQILESINRDPDTYEHTLHYAYGLASKYGLSIDPAQIPAYNPLGITSLPDLPGVVPLGNGQVAIIADGSHLGISNIDEASRFGESFFTIPE